MRFIIFFLAAAVVWWLFRRLLRSSSKARPPTSQVETKIKATDQEVMVACTHCHVHLPRSEAVFQGDLSFCGEAHRLAYRQSSSNT